MPPVPPSYKSYPGSREEFLALEEAEAKSVSEKVRLFFHRWYQKPDLDGRIYVFKVMDNKAYLKYQTCWKAMTMADYNKAFGIKGGSDRSSGFATRD